MAIGLTQDRGIEFINKFIDGYNYKGTNGVDSDMGFISFYRDISVIDYIIGNIDTTLKGQFATINDDISNEAGDIAFITPEGIEFWDDEAKHVVGICSLQEFRELLIAWKSFLQTPPFDGSKVD